MSHKELTATGLIDKMIHYEIFKVPAPRTDEGYYDVQALQFTRKFTHDCKETLARLAMDPTNISLNAWEGFKSVVLNFTRDKVDEEELNKMIMMVLSLMAVRKSVE